MGKHYGKNFTETDKFDELITGVSDAILETTTPRQPEPKPLPLPPVVPSPLSSLPQNSGQYAMPDYLSTGFTLSTPSLNLLQSNQTTAVPQLSSSAPQLDVNFLDIIESGQLSRLK